MKKNFDLNTVTMSREFYDRFLFYSAKFFEDDILTGFSDKLTKHVKKYNPHLRLNTLIEFKNNVKKARYYIHKLNRETAFVVDDNGRLNECVIIGPVPGKKEYVRVALDPLTTFVVFGNKRNIHATRLYLGKDDYEENKDKPFVEPIKIIGEQIAKES